ncbi:MAG: hypothetical protein M1290_00955 [Candidatus Thermoplasmatota archaeon]|jgi:hypothetical protein|nr:hypothetical protein [Candidatus Thermoplasmatota archaeon]MCL5789019.1 hypothetical protein [Candidatus Thermoplasmatota archaeon]
MSSNKESILGAVPFAITVLLWNVPFFLGGIVVEGNVLLEVIIGEAVIFSGILLVSHLRGRLGRLYLISSYISMAILVTLVETGLWRFALFSAVAFLISIRFFLTSRKRLDFSTGTLAFLIFMLILFLSTSLRIVHSSLTGTGATGYLFSIYNNSSPAGVPFTYAYGIVAGLRGVTLTLSPLTAVFFPLIAYLTADNTMLIVKGSATGRTVSATGAVVAALACQCENTIGILSGTVSSLALSILPFFIFLSAGLLIATNVYLHNPIKMKLPRIKTWVVVTAFLIILAIEFLIVSTGLVYDLALFGLVSFLSIISGFLLGMVIPLKRSIPVYSVIFAFAIQAVMFWPHLISAALVTPSVFEAYNISGLVAGIILSLSFRNRSAMTKVGLVELIFSMETMITAIFLYITLFSLSLFNGFTEIAVIDFSVFILLLSLPLMWFSNIYLLSVRAFGS